MKCTLDVVRWVNLFQQKLTRLEVSCRRTLLWSPLPSGSLRYLPKTFVTKFHLTTLQIQHKAEWYALTWSCCGPFQNFLNDLKILNNILNSLYIYKYYILISCLKLISCYKVSIILLSHRYYFLLFPCFKIILFYIVNINLLFGVIIILKL